ncbi:TPA: aminodeoxychorismate synthase, component I, partial [Streptococcus agalactiae]|nr:aminodeoxychorismate synthase, component I [Streptococcus agalactiae]
MHIETVIDFKELGKRYRFKNPTKELIADTLEQVLEVIKEVDYYQSQNYYVVGYLSYEACAAFDSHFKVSQQKLAGEHLAYF